MHYQQYFIDCTFSYWKLLEYITLILERLLKGTQEHNWQGNWIVVIRTALCRGKENSSQAFSKALYAAVLHYRLFQRGERWETINLTLFSPQSPCTVGWARVYFHSLIISRKLFRYFASFHTVGVVYLWLWYIYILSSHIFLYYYTYAILLIYTLYIEAHCLTHWCGIMLISYSSWLP